MVNDGPRYLWKLATRFCTLRQSLHILVQIYRNASRMRNVIKSHGTGQWGQSKVLTMHGYVVLESTAHQLIALFDLTVQSYIIHARMWLSLPLNARVYSPKYCFFFIMLVFMYLHGQLRTIVWLCAPLTATMHRVQKTNIPKCDGQIHKIIPTVFPLKIQHL